MGADLCNPRESPTDHRACLFEPLFTGGFLFPEHLLCSTEHFLGTIIPILGIMDTQLFELVKSIRNRCEVLLLLSVAYPEGEIKNIIPTILEDIHEDSQEIIERYCIDGQPT